MNSKRKSVEVITGEKITADVDLNRAVKGTSSPAAAISEVAGRSSEAPFIFECAWCGAVNYGERRDSAFYVCFACGRPMSLALG